jgi:hypothetical protein
MRSRVQALLDEEMKHIDRIPGDYLNNIPKLFKDEQLDELVSRASRVSGNMHMFDVILPCTECTIRGDID